MKSKDEIIVVSLGGSILFPGEVNVAYIKKLREFLITQTKRDKKFMLIVGGGVLAREYQKAASEVVPLTDSERDWVGVRATHLNAYFLKTVLGDMGVYPEILTNPEKSIKKSDLKKYSIFVGAGWKPGWSTDYVTFRLANAIGVSNVVLATNIPYLYDKDLNIYKDAKPIKETTWNDYKKLIGGKWSPGMKAPVDPVASQFAQKNKMTSVLLLGTNLKNLEAYLEGRKFKGTVFEG